MKKMKKGGVTLTDGIRQHFLFLFYALNMIRKRGISKKQIYVVQNKFVALASDHDFCKYVDVINRSEVINN